MNKLDPEDVVVRVRKVSTGARPYVLHVEGFGTWQYRFKTKDAAIDAGVKFVNARGYLAVGLNGKRY